jgi:Protein of unknown function (DUF3445)
MSDFILMDNTYLDMLHKRRKVIAERLDDVVGFHPVARDAVHELYIWMFGTYLPKRFPSMFSIQNFAESEKRGNLPSKVRNLVTQEDIHLDPLPEPVECIKILGNHVDCEYAILLPTSDPNAAPFRAEPTDLPTVPYHLHAFLLAFPSGFTPAQKMGLPLGCKYLIKVINSMLTVEAIHGPVPGYSTKLEKSMDRYFATLPFGKIIWRSNWSISTDSVLFRLGAAGHHTDTREHSNSSPKNGKVDMAPPHYEPKPEELAQWKEQSKAIDGNKCSLRMERQTLHRLEKTGALVFGFKTFLEPLSELKKEGCGPRLADALNGLKAGSAPAMDVYKNGVIWREPLVEYLTS